MGFVLRPATQGGKMGLTSSAECACPREGELAHEPQRKQQEKELSTQQNLVSHKSTHLILGSSSQAGWAQRVPLAAYGGVVYIKNF